MQSWNDIADHVRTRLTEERDASIEAYETETVEPIRKLAEREIEWRNTEIALLDAILAGDEPAPELCWAFSESEIGDQAIHALQNMRKNRAGEGGGTGRRTDI